MLYIIKDQHNRILDKQMGWAGHKKNALFLRSPHYDEALNKLVELSSQDIKLRGSVIACDIDKYKHPILPNDIGLIPEDIPTSCQDQPNTNESESPLSG